MRSNPEWSESSVKPESAKSTFWQVSLKVLAALLVVAGLLSGLFIAFIWNFCIKDCPEPGLVQGTSYVWAPLASLLFTVPVSLLMVNAAKKPSDPKPDDT